MTKYRFSDGAAIVFGGSGGLGSGIVDLLSKCGTDVAFTYLNNEEAAKEKGQTAPLFSQGLYHWVMFILSLYTRVREKLNIDYESFVILQVVVSHSLYQINKTGAKTFTELEDQMTKFVQNKKIRNNKLTFASIAEVLQLPRETVRRKVISLAKKDILIFSSYSGVKLGPAYKTIYKDFVSQTTLDLSSLIKKWEKTGALRTLLELEK